MRVEMKTILYCLFFLTVAGQRSKKLRYIRGEVLDSFYNVYDPSYLAVVWPTVRNGVHLSINELCFEDVKLFFKEFTRGRAWAFIVAGTNGFHEKIDMTLNQGLCALVPFPLKSDSPDGWMPPYIMFAPAAADASGHYNSGVYSGRRHWLGSKKQCLALDENTSIRENKSLEKFRNEAYLNAVLRRDFTHGQDWSKQDELVRRAVVANSSPPVRLAFSTVQLTLNITKFSMAKCHEIVQGVCLPRSCSPEDVKAVMNFSVVITDTLRSNKTIPRTVIMQNSRRIEKSYDYTVDVQAISLLTVTLSLVILCTLATLLDYNVIKCRRHVKTKTFNVQKYNNDLKACAKTNVVDMETLTINNMDNSNNINLVTVKKVIKHNAVPPSITLDVVSLENGTNSCKRCGKYKKQCPNPKKIENLQSCPRIKYQYASGARKPSLMQYLLLCFSFNYSWKRIFNTNMANKDLSIMHGLRIVTTFWVVFIHVAIIAGYLSDSGVDLKARDNIYMVVATGSLAFDTLFFVSGLFSSYHFFYLKSQYSVEELVSFGGGCGQVLQLCCFITNRAVRLLPSYVYAIFLAGILSRGAHQTSTLELPGRDYDCGATWWWNILYVTNVYPTEERCLQISWYLTAETQLHAFGALLCAVAARRRTALALAAAAVVAAAAADVRAAVAEYGAPLPDVFALYRLVMERPWARVAPYLIGVFAGWLVRQMGGKLTVTRLTASCLWLASACALGLSWAVPWAGPAWAAAWLHLLWPAVLLWPALVCATDYAGFCRRLLDSGAVAALSRLCYGVLLLHDPISRTVLLGFDSPLCSNTMCIWFYFAGTTVLTLIASLLLALLVEMPCCSLLRRLSDCATFKS